MPGCPIPVRSACTTPTRVLASRSIGSGEHHESIILTWARQLLASAPTAVTRRSCGGAGRIIPRPHAGGYLRPPSGGRLYLRL